MGQIWLDGLLPRLDTVPLCCFVFSLGFWSSSNPLYTGYTGYAGYTGYTVALLPVTPFQRISVSEASSYQHISVSTFQRISVSTFPAYRRFQRTSVPAYQRISVLRCRLATYQALSRTAYQRRNHVRTRIATTLLFSRVCSCSGFCGKWESLAAKRKKKAGKVPQTENQKNR